MAKRSEVVEFLNSLFEIENYEDASLNGLQVEGSEDVTGFCLGVDACSELIDKGIEKNLNFTIVHHGFFWGQQFPITGIWKNRLKKLLNNDVSLYACHLPMDASENYGHNSEMALKLGLKSITPFGNYKGKSIGFSGTLLNTISIDKITNILNETLQTKCKLLHCGKNTINKIGIVSGGGASESILTEAFNKNIDLFITGEIEHSVFHIIKEMNLNVVFAGHYETEKFSLLKLEKLLYEKFKLPSKFFYIPTEM